MSYSGPTEQSQDDIHLHRQFCGAGVRSCHVRGHGQSQGAIPVGGSDCPNHRHRQFNLLPVVHPGEKVGSGQPSSSPLYSLQGTKN